MPKAGVRLFHRLFKTNIPYSEYFTCLFRYNSLLFYHPLCQINEYNGNKYMENEITNLQIENKIIILRDKQVIIDKR